MKFLLPLFLMPFLCVKCCPWDDCEGDDLVCEELSPLPPQLENAIPYGDGEMLNFRFADAPEVITINTFRSEIAAGAGQNCQDGIVVTLRSENADRPFSLRLETDLFGRSLLVFDFSFAASPVLEPELFEVLYDEMEVPSVTAPNSLRFIPDTMLAGVNYQNVAEVKIMGGLATSEINAFYYNRNDGLLRVERIDSPAFFRVE